MNLHTKPTFLKQIITGRVLNGGQLYCIVSYVESGMKWKFCSFLFDRVCVKENRRWGLESVQYQT